MSTVLERTCEMLLDRVSSLTQNLAEREEACRALESKEKVLVDAMESVGVRMSALEEELRSLLPAQSQVVALVVGIVGKIETYNKGRCNKGRVGTELKKQYPLLVTRDVIKWAVDSRLLRESEDGNWLSTTSSGGERAPGGVNARLDAAGGLDPAARAERSEFDYRTTSSKGDTPLSDTPRPYGSTPFGGNARRMDEGLDTVARAERSETPQKRARSESPPRPPPVVAVPLPVASRPSPHVTMPAGPKFKCPDCHFTFPAWQPCMLHLTASGHGGGGGKKALYPRCVVNPTHQPTTPYGVPSPSAPHKPPPKVATVSDETHFSFQCPGCPFVSQSFKLCREHMKEANHPNVGPLNAKGLYMRCRFVDPTSTYKPPEGEGDAKSSLRQALEKTYPGTSALTMMGFDTYSLDEYTFVSVCTVLGVDSYGGPMPTRGGAEQNAALLALEFFKEGLSA